jgi:hypothetical protein
MKEICHTLLEATITLYAADEAGRPLTGLPIWSGVAAENLTLTERWIKIQNRPTAARQPRNHPLVAQFEIAIGRVWALLQADLNGFITEPARYVLDLVWADEDENCWHRKTFYGVTIAERSQASPNADREFTDHQVFDAESLVPASGTGAVTEISEELPYLVRYVTAQGSLAIYVYDPDEHTFTELVAGLAAQTAELGFISGGSALTYRGATHYRNSQPYRVPAAFRVRFQGETDDALRVRNDGVVEVAGSAIGAPRRDSLPRVDFCYGGKRLASISRSGVLYAWAFEEGAMEEVTPGYEIASGETLLATITQKAVRASDFTA